MMRPPVCVQIEDLPNVDVECAVVEGIDSLLQLAAAFKLFADPSIYREIDHSAAHLIITRLLHRTLAYEMPVTSKSEAARLGGRFLQLFADSNPRYYTNGHYDQPPKQTAPDVLTLTNWSPATIATFDTGVLVLGTDTSGGIWVQDED